MLNSVYLISEKIRNLSSLKERPTISEQVDFLLEVRTQLLEEALKRTESEEEMLRGLKALTAAFKGMLNE